MRHPRVPARAAASAVGRPVTIGRAGQRVVPRIIGMHAARRQIESRGSRAVHQRSRNAHQQVLGKRLRAQVFPDDGVFTSGQPVLDLGRSADDSDDVEQHLEALQITTVEPAEVQLAGLRRLPVDELHHRVDPPLVSEVIEPTLVRVLDVGNAKEAAERVAGAADAVLDLRQLPADPARRCRRAPGVAGHLARVGEPTDDLPCPPAGHADEGGEDVCRL